MKKVKSSRGFTVIGTLSTENGDGNGNANTERKDWGENAVVTKHGKKSRRDGKYLSRLISFHFILMSSLKAARNHLLISHFEGVINNEEF